MDTKVRTVNKVVFTGEYDIMRVIALMAPFLATKPNPRKRSTMDEGIAVAQILLFLRSIDPDIVPNVLIGSSRESLGNLRQRMRAFICKMGRPDDDNLDEYAPWNAQWKALREKITSKLWLDLEFRLNHVNSLIPVAINEAVYDRLLDLEGVITNEQNRRGPVQAGDRKEI